MTWSNCLYICRGVTETLVIRYSTFVKYLNRKGIEREVYKLIKYFKEPIVRLGGPFCVAVSFGCVTRMNPIT